MVNSAKQNDSPTLTHQFKDGNGDVVDLSQNGPYGEPNEILVTVESPEGPVVNGAQAEITNAQEGRVEYNLETSDTGFAGEYETEWESRWGLVDGRDLVLTSPSSGYQTFTVDVSLGDTNASEISSDTLTGDVDAGGFDILNGGEFEADVITAGILEDRSSGAQVDIDSLASGFPSVSNDGTTQVSPGAPDLNAGTGLEAVNDGDDTVTFNVTGGGGGGSLDITDGQDTATDPSELLLQATGAASINVDDDGDGTATATVGATDTDTHIDVEENGSALKSDPNVLNLGSNLSGSVSGDTVTISASSDGGGGSLTAAERRRRAYQSGPTVTLPSTICASASQTGGDAEFVEESVPLRDGYRLELIEAGASDEDPDGTSEARVIVADTPNDPTTYTQVYSTLDTDAIPEDGSGNIDFTSTITDIDNTSGNTQRIFFRAANSDSSASEYAVWGNFTVIRRPIP